MLEMWKSRTHDEKLQNPTGTNKGGDRGERELGAVKRRKSPVKDGLRDRAKKAIRITNLYAVLNNTESLDNDADHIMVKVKLHNGKQAITTNAMIDSGATEDFIDKGFCAQNNLPLTKVAKPREIYVVDGTASSAGPITHITTVPMDIGDHKEMITFSGGKLSKA